MSWGCPWWERRWGGAVRSDLRMKSSRAVLNVVGLTFLALAGACITGEGGVTDPDEPAGSPPAAPSIMQLLPMEQEPRRGMHVAIHDASDDENGFTLQRREPGGSFSDVANLRANAETFDDWGLEASIEYAYRIRAYNNYGNSAWSAAKTQTSTGLLIVTLFTYTIADAYVEESRSNTNLGDERYFHVAGKEGYWGGRAHGLISFSLPVMPSHAMRFESAFLRLCEAGGGNTIYPGSIDVYAVAAVNQWNENAVTWNTRPGTWLSTYGHNVHNPNQQACVIIDVSEVVSAWYSDVRANHGFMLFSNSNAYVPYYSKEGYAPGSALLDVRYVW